jgi:Pyridoxamine 5'-phosphate oxidase
MDDSAVGACGNHLPVPSGDHQAGSPREVSDAGGVGCGSYRIREVPDNEPVTQQPFDVDAFLAQPLTARVATSGPTVRPTWYLWEEEAFWILTGPWAKLPARVQADPAIAIVVDVCDLATGLVRQVIARGRAEILPYDVARGRRKLRRYLGQDETRWDSRFRHYLLDDPAQKGTVWLRLRPDSLAATDLSYSV